MVTYFFPACNHGNQPVDTVSDGTFLERCGKTELLPGIQEGSFRWRIYLQDHNKPTDIMKILHEYFIKMI